MVMAGVNVIAVSKMLRHSDVKITANVYAHLSPEYLRAEVDKMKLGTGVPELLEPLRAAVNAGSAAVEGPNWVQGSTLEKKNPEVALISSATPGLSTATSRGLEPLTFGVTGRRSNQLN